MPDAVDCVIEIPKGSRNKYEWDPEVGSMRLDRFLSSSVVFPADYGFIPESREPDGEDELDVLVAVSEPTFPGCRILSRPVAVLRLRKGDEYEEKVLCVPLEDPNWQDVTSVEQVPEQLRIEIADFFPTYLRREGTEVEVGEWDGAEAAAGVIERAQRAYRERS